MSKRCGWSVAILILAVAALSCGCKDKDKPLIIDATAPTTSAAPPGGHYPAPVTVTLSATDDFDAEPDMYYTVDGATTPTTLSSHYEDATKIDIVTDTTLQWIAVDDWKNESAVHSEVYVIDTVAPTLNSSLASGYYDATQTMTLTAADDKTPVVQIAIYYTIDGVTTPTTASTPYTVPISILTDTVVMAIAYDLAGNPSAVLTRDIVIDTVAPTATASVDSGHYNATFLVTLTGADDKSAAVDIDIYYTTDTSDPDTGSTLFTTDIEIATTLTLKFIAYDQATNPSIIYQRDYVIDTQAPVVTIIDPALDNEYVNATHRFQFDVPDPGDSYVDAVYVLCTAVSVSWQAATYSGAGDVWYFDVDTTTIVDASEDMEVYATDLATNESTHEVRTFIVDNTDPTCSITTPVDSTVVGGTVVVDGTANDPAPGTLDTVEIRIEDSGGSPVLDWTVAGSPWYNWDTTAVSNGDYTILARATDQAGNTCTPVSVSVTVDNTPPTTTCVSPAADEWITGSSYTIQLSCTDTGAAGVSQVFYQFDGTGGSWTEAVYNAGSGFYEDLIDTNPLSDGAHQIYVYAVDTVGNAETAHFTSFNVDNAVPVVSDVTAPTDGAWVTGNSYTVTITADDLHSGVAQVLVSIDGGTSNTANDLGGGNYDYDWDTTAESDGPNTIEVWALDNVGILSNVFTRNCNVDNEVPTCSIDDPGTDGDWVTGTHTITISATDLYSDIANAYVQIDAGGWIAMVDAGGGQYTYDWNTTGESAGNHTISVYVQDNVGLNNQSTPVLRTCNVDNDQPTVGDVTSPAEDAWVNGNSYTINITGVSDGAGSNIAQVLVSINGGTSTTASGGGGNYSYDWDTTAESDGPNTIEVWALDNVGILSNVFTRNCNVDNTPPSSYCSSPGDSSVTKDVDELQVTATDGAGCGIPAVNSVYVACSNGANWLNAAGTAFDQGSETFHACTDAGGGIYTFDTSGIAVWVDGPYWVKTYALDNLGNTESPATLTTFAIDSTVATVTINSVTSDTVGPSLTSTINWQSDADGNYQVNVGGDGTWGSGTNIASGACTAGTPIDTLVTNINITDDTTETVWIVVSPTVGNDGNNSTQIHDDETAPDDPVADPVGGPQTVPINVELTASDDWDSNPKIYYTEDGSAPDSGDTEYTVLISISSNTTLRFIAYDAGGNTSNIMQEVYVYDAVPPTTTINAPTLDEWMSGTYVVDLTVIDSGGTVATVMVQVVGYGAFEATNIGGNNWTYNLDTTAGYGDGAQTIKCWGVDNSLNSEESIAPTVAVNFDNSAPTSTCTSPAASSWTNATPILTISGTCDDGSGSGVTQVWVNPGGAGWGQAVVTGGNAWSYDWTNPTEGAPVTVQYYAVDDAGNTEATNSHDFNIDYTPPSSNADILGGVYTNPISVQLSASDILDGSPEIWYTDDGTDPKISGSRQLYSGAININVTTTLKFYAVDAAGNEEDVNTEDYIIGSPPTFVGAFPNWGNVRTGTNVYLLFDDEPMDKTSVESNFLLTIQGEATPLTGQFYWRVRASDGVEVCTFVPDDYLDDNTTYNCDFTSLPTSDAGIPLVWFPSGGFTFQTANCTPPVITSRDPGIDEIVVNPASKRLLTVVFNATMENCWLWLEDPTGDEDIFEGDTWEPALSLTGAATNILVLDFDMVYDGENIDDVNDDGDQLSWWWLEGASKDDNTDANGKLYVELFDGGGPGPYTVKLYKDSGMAALDLVASGSSGSTQNWLNLSEENSSGLSGGVNMEYTADDADIELPIQFFEIEPGKAYEVGISAWDNSWNQVEDEWVFYGQGNAESDPPEVVDSLPANTATNISPRRIIHIFMSEPIDPNSFDTGDLTINDGSPATYQYQVKGSMIAVYPDRALSGGVTVTLNANSVDDLAPTPNSGPSGDFVLIFNVSDDSTDPVISWVLPASGTVDMQNWEFGGAVMFSERMSDQLPVGALTFVEADSGAPVKGIELRPAPVFDSDLGGYSVMGIVRGPEFAGLVYWDEAVSFNLTLSANIEDLAGNTLGSDYTWPVTTRADNTVDYTPFFGDYSFDENVWIELFANGNATFEFEVDVRDEASWGEWRQEQIGTGNGSQTNWNGTLTSYPLEPNTVSFNASGMNASDDGAGNINGGDAVGTIDYMTGAYAITWTAGPPADQDQINVSYNYKPSFAIEVLDTGDGSQTLFTGTLSATPVVRNSFSVMTADGGGFPMQAWADWDGRLNGDVSPATESYVDYETGDYSITWDTPPGNNEDITARYESGLDITVTNGFSTWTLIPESGGRYEYETPEPDDFVMPGAYSDPQWVDNPGWNTFTFTITDAVGHTVTFYKRVYIPDPSDFLVCTYPDTCDALLDTTPTFTWNPRTFPMEGVFTWLFLADATGGEDPDLVGQFILGSRTDYTLPSELALSTGLYIWAAGSSFEGDGGDGVSAIGVEMMFEKAFWIYDPALGSISGTISPDSTVTDREMVMAGVFDATGPWPPSEEEPLAWLFAKYNSGPQTWTYAIYNLPDGDYYAFGFMNVVGGMDPDPGDAIGAYLNFVSPTAIVISSGTDWINRDFTLFPVP